jgi:hypothetical protein
MCLIYSLFCAKWYKLSVYTVQWMLADAILADGQVWQGLVYGLANSKYFGWLSMFANK